MENLKKDDFLEMSIFIIFIKMMGAKVRRAPNRFHTSSTPGSGRGGPPLPPRWLPSCHCLLLCYHMYAYMIASFATKEKRGDFYYGALRHDASFATKEKRGDFYYGITHTTSFINYNPLVDASR